MNNTEDYVKMLPEQLSEKLTTKIKVVNKLRTPDFEYFIKIRDFEKQVTMITLTSFLMLIGSTLI